MSVPHFVMQEALDFGNIDISTFGGWLSFRVLCFRFPLLSSLSDTRMRLLWSGAWETINFFFVWGANGSGEGNRRV